MKWDMTKVVEEIATQAKENQEEFIFETIHPYCENILQMKINKEELKRIILRGVRPKGKWIKIQSGDKDFPESIVCSRCENENSHLDFDEHSEPVGKVFVTSKYCPNCGADMGGADETN